MKNIFVTLTIVAAIVMAFSSCRSEETYAEQRDREYSSIDAFIAKNGIKVITEKEFTAKGCTTEANEYVRFDNSGVYMNIVSKGTDGEPLAKGKSEDVLVRYQEQNITNSDGQQTSNMQPDYTNLCDKFNVRNQSGTYIAQLVYGVLLNSYGSQQVPGGWLVPLKYINLGRGDMISEDGKLAAVRLIVPHDQGTGYANSGVYAYYYYMTYELDR